MFSLAGYVPCTLLYPLPAPPDQPSYLSVLRPPGQPELSLDRTTIHLCKIRTNHKLVGSFLFYFWEQILLVCLPSKSDIFKIVIIN